MWYEKIISAHLHAWPDNGDSPNSTKQDNMWTAGRTKEVEWEIYKDQPPPPGEHNCNMSVCKSGNFHIPLLH